MATNSKGRIEITDLDFDTVKQNFKTFLSQQNSFTDYNFEGSGMSVLMDLLAYNTHYMAFHANMLANEMFIDTALTRDAAVSHAKALGYLPSSPKASNTTLRVTVSDVPLSQKTLVMDSGTIFSTTVNDTSYNFVTIGDNTATSETGIFMFTDVQVYEGTRIRYTYTVNSSDLEQKFIIPSASADTTTLVVSDQTSSSDITTETYTLNTDYATLDSTSLKYFLQEADDGQYEVYFGDGVTGKKPIDGNIVILDYVVTNGSEADGASAFTASSSIGGFTNISVVTTGGSSAGGGDA